MSGWIFFSIYLLFIMAHWPRIQFIANSLMPSTLPMSSLLGSSVLVFFSPAELNARIQIQQRAGVLSASVVAGRYERRCVCVRMTHWNACQFSNKNKPQPKRAKKKTVDEHSLGIVGLVSFIFGGNIVPIWLGHEWYAETRLKIWSHTLIVFGWNEKMFCKNRE